MELTTATLQELRDNLDFTQTADEYNVISNRIAELELIEQSQAVELETVTAEAAKFMDGLDFGGDKIVDIFINYTEDKAKESYNYVNSVIQNAIVAMKRAALAKESSLESELAAVKEERDSYETTNNQLNIDIGAKTLDIADLTSRFNNASRLLDEEKAEVERLKSQVEDLRVEIALGAAAAIQVVEVDVRTAREKYDEARRKEEEAKPLIYNVRWKDEFKKNIYVANLAETDEEIEFPYIQMSGDIANQSAMKGKYRVVTSLEADTFRAAKEEQERSDADRARVLELEEQPVTAPPYPTESSTDDSASAEPGLAEESPTVAGSTITEERILAIEERLAAIESARTAA